MNTAKVVSLAFAAAVVAGCKTSVPEDGYRPLFNGSDLSAAFVGEGSVATVLALVSLIAAIISICLTIGYNKGKALPAATDHASENEE